jgi:hypothetical protein
MPAVYQGSTTAPASTTTWSATTPYTAGTSYVTPIENTGQYFQCTVSGTSGSTEPAWHTSATLPVPGQTFTDNTATWTCMGSILAAPNNVVVDTPVDADPSLVSSIVRGLKGLANNIKYIFVNAGFLSANNTWTGTTNTFTGQIDANTIESSGVAQFATLEVTGNASVTNNLVVDNNATVDNNLTVDVLTTTSTLQVNAGVVGSLNIYGGLSVGGAVSHVDGVPTVGTVGTPIAIATYSSVHIGGTLANIFTSNFTVQQGCIYEIKFFCVSVGGTNVSSANVASWLYLSTDFPSNVHIQNSATGDGATIWNDTGNAFNGGSITFVPQASGSQTGNFQMSVSGGGGMNVTSVLIQYT